MIDLGFLPPRPIAVLGLGRSGRAVALAAAAAGRTVWAWDDNAAARETASAAGLALADPVAADLSRAAMLVLSPGIPLHHPAPHPLVERARAGGCPVVGDLELLIRARPGVPVVGITGTNGKSTTTALIGHVLTSAGRTAAVGGNIGVPALELPALDADGVYVLEISSYQLDLTPSLACAVSVLLNITPDHLDRHGGMAGYVAAKRRIFAGQKPGDTAVIGVDDVHGRAIADDLRTDPSAPRVVAVSGRDPVEGGVFARGGTLYDATAGAPRAVFDLATAPALPGEHNAQNAAAAWATVRALGVDEADAAAAMTRFPGLAHRQERLAVIDGIAWINDSKATNADAAARALASYGAIYWIAGGRPKEGSLDAVLPHLGHVRHAYLIGEAAAPFAEALAGRVPVTVAGTLDRAVTAAAAQARRNGVADPVVLLSPACSSYDQFRDFEARGDAFRALVAGLRP